MGALKLAVNHIFGPWAYLQIVYEGPEIEVQVLIGNFYDENLRFDFP
ncbi:hypothetical protein PEL8287_02977 [Roseovarius litorisediminis]|uniref:Uncharacterized protein n=1 Tax=Roseovarius litorisediminis TaxID=1312363 RepID=A0A1Y5T4C2_9RHOB|nr:hypothetical protein [Roseovarius litorisediminis]SLN55683.1 hypothetical protein PEL8287_02977 [Roseovarius litorisediminis]